MSNYPLYKSPEDFTAQVLATLKQVGVSTTAADDFNFYLYLDTRALAQACVQPLRADGFTVKIERAVTGSVKPWLCLASQRLAPSAERLAQIGSIFMKLADEHDGNFDGWEIQPKPMNIPEGLLKSFMEEFSRAKKKKEK